MPDSDSDSSPRSVGPVIGSACSGYGGLDLGLITVLGGGRVAWHVENDPHPSAVLDARWPGVPNYGDLTTVDWTQVEPVDWFTAGYPCQPFSHAGKRKGSSDERHLWPAVAHAIGVLRPRRVLLENVAGHLSLGLDIVTADLAAMGYVGRYGVVRAADAGAPHGRARVFIAAADARSGPFAGPAAARDGLSVAPERGAQSAADAAGDGRHEGWAEPTRIIGRPDAAERGHATADSESDTGRVSHRDDVPVERSEQAWGPYEPAIRRWEAIIGRAAPRPTERGRTGERLSPRFVEWMQGLPDGWVTDILPRNPALKALGNGVVPQQAALAVSVLRHNRSDLAA